MTIYIILIALFNLCVGYFTAVHLGFGRKWRAAGSFPVARPDAVDEGEQEAAAADAGAASSPAAAEPDSAVQLEDAPEAIAEDDSASAAFEALASASGMGEDGPPAPDEPGGQSPETPVDETPADEATVEADVDPADGADETEPAAEAEAADDAGPQGQPPPSLRATTESGEDPQSTSDVDDEACRLVAACVADFKRELERYRQQLGEIETRVRGASDAPQVEELQQCVAGLKSANSEFLEKQGGISQRLQSRKDHGQFADVAASVGRAMAEQKALVEFSNANIEQVDPENELETGFQRLLGEASLLSENSEHVDQTLDHAKETIDQARRETGRQPADVDVDVDVNDAVRDNEEITQSLNTFWSDDPERTRELTVGVVGIDKTAQLREQIGDDSVEKLFAAVNTVVEDAVGKKGPVLRHSPHVFVVLFQDTGAREATNLVEQIRQTVAAARFAYRESHVPVTVSCAVTPAGAEDAVETLMDRVDATLKESSRYGENRTFLYEDTHAAPVVPPQLDIDEITVRL